MGILYLITTLKCNLRCAHCYIDESEEYFNDEEFLNKMNSFDGHMVLFGGEFTANLERMWKIVNSNKEHGIRKIESASTNLTILNDELLELYKEINSIGTSWNRDRFGTDQMYKTWLKNLKTLYDNDIYFTILITLTKDLIEMDVDEWLELAKDFDYEGMPIKFEHYVGPIEEGFYERVDDWLCELYKKWNLKSDLLITERVCNWMFDCNETYSLFPDGTMVNRCPQNLPAVVPTECLTCERAEVCRPCRLIPVCSFPKKLYELVKADNKVQQHFE